LVDASINDGDPIEVALKILKQMDASYVVMSLKDYLALQDGPRAEEVRKAVQVIPERRKVTVSFRRTPVGEALSTIAKDSFYITFTGPGSFLIIPDVKVLDENVLPPIGSETFRGRGGYIDIMGILDAAGGFGGGSLSLPMTSEQAQAACVAYVRRLITAIRKYADDHAGYLPDGKTWVSEIPVKDPAMLSAGPRYQNAYAMNAELSGRKLAGIKNQEKTVLIFECDSSIGQGTEKDLAKSFRHPDGNTYGFLDGHVGVLKVVPKFNP
jgi:prepilin-type processing-associated H-X9-DG protein